MMGPDRFLSNEDRPCVNFVESDPHRLVLTPPLIEAQELGQVAARGASEQDLAALSRRPVEPLAEASASRPLASGDSGFDQLGNSRRRRMQHHRCGGIDGETSRFRERRIEQVAEMIGIAGEKDLASFV